MSQILRVVSQAVALKRRYSDCPQRTKQVRSYNVANNPTRTDEEKERIAKMGMFLEAQTKSLTLTSLHKNALNSYRVGRIAKTNDWSINMGRNDRSLFNLRAEQGKTSVSKWNTANILLEHHTASRSTCCRRSVSETLGKYAEDPLAGLPHNKKQVRSYKSYLGSYSVSADSR